MAAIARCNRAAPAAHLLQSWSAWRTGLGVRRRDPCQAAAGHPYWGVMRRQPIDPLFVAEPAPPARLCEHPGCECGGEFRAPRSRLELDRYYWFCLEHVRAYNLAWNYYAGMSEPEIESEIRRDTVWQRPSWKLGERHGPIPGVRDPFGFYTGNEHDGDGRRTNGHAGGHTSGRANGHAGGPAGEAAMRAASARAQAIAVFDLEPPLTPVRLKARYKTLVKEHHPDAHGGDKAAEEKLKIINQAYATLKAGYFN